MPKGRLEAFSDGVIAIIITIMVLELKIPHGETLDTLRPLYPVFLTYVLSFINVGIYWNNHHHMFHAAQRINAAVMWANLHLLFWLSLFPFVTGWTGHNHFAPAPVALYGAVSLMAGVAYYILAQALVRHHGKDSPLGVAIGKDRKGLFSIFLYAVAMPLSFVRTWIALGLYVTVALIWLYPDRRIEKVIA